MHEWKENEVQPIQRPKYIQCVLQRLAYENYQSKELSKITKLRKNGIANKNIFPCLYTHQVTATGFLHLHTTTFSTLPFPALNVLLPLTSLLETMPNSTFDAVTRSLYHLYATPLPSFTPRFPGICVQRSATFFRTRPRATRCEGSQWNAWCDTFFLVQTEKETEKLACAPHLHTRRAG